MLQHIYGNVVSEIGVCKALITIDGDRIIDVYWGPQDTTALNVIEYDDNHLIFPGFVDIHVHCREDVSGKDTHKEDYKTVGRAALNGGVVCVADMPNNPIVPFDLERYDQKRFLAESHCPIDVVLYAAVNQDSSPFGNYPYKAFVGPSTNHSGDLNFDNYDRLDEAMARYSGHQVSFHCEDPALLNQASGQPTHEQRRPANAEVECIKKVIEICHRHNVRAKICHVSTKGGLEAILEARARGVQVECEVTPHHLYFDTSMLNEENRRWLQMNPPIRSAEDRLFLLEALKNGDIQYLATDHAPHTKDEKLRGTSGVPQLDTYAAFVAWLIVKQGVAAETIYRTACLNPGIWVGSFNPYRFMGRVKSGYEASLTIIDLSRSAVDGRGTQTKCGWSPFDLRSLPGLAQTVWYKGERVVDGLYMKDFS